MSLFLAGLPEGFPPKSLGNLPGPRGTQQRWEPNLLASATCQASGVLEAGLGGATGGGQGVSPAEGLQGKDKPARRQGETGQTG